MTTAAERRDVAIVTGGARGIGVAPAIRPAAVCALLAVLASGALVRHLARR